MKNLIKLQITKMFKNSENTTLWGFKEIRYENKNIKLLKEFKELFPNVKIIINIREDTQKQSQSSWFKNDPNSKIFLDNENNNFKEFYEKNKEYCYLNTFEKIFDMNNIKNMFEFIDCKEEFNEEKIKNVLENELKSI